MSDRKITTTHVSGTISPLGTRRPDKMAERLAQRIVDDVIERNLPPGSKLPAEAEMIRSYSVGRATLREALRLLEVQGIIFIKPGPGGGPTLEAAGSSSFARMMQLHLRMRAASYAEVLEARLAIEPLMARQAAEAQSKKGMKLLRQTIEAAEKADLNDEAAWQASADNFHAVIASISGNTVLDMLGMSLKEIYHTRSRSAITPLKLRSGIIAVHRAIAEAILRGDGTKAERLMRDHMAHYATRSKKLHSKNLKHRIPW